VRAVNIYFSLLNIVEESLALHERRQASTVIAHVAGSFHDTLLNMKLRASRSKNWPA